MAKGRVTKELEDWVLWDLPLARALAYQHCALRNNGQWTVPIDSELSEKFDEMLSRPSTHDEEFDLIGGDFDEGEAQ